LKKVEVVSEMYLYMDVGEPREGALSVNIAPSGFNRPESHMTNPIRRNPNRFISSKKNNEGMGVYILDSESEVSYDIPITTSKKMNILIQSSNLSADDVDILINDKVVKNIDA